MFGKIMKLAERQGFLTKFHSTLKRQHFKIGPVGALLKNNLQSDWLNNILNQKEISVFLNEHASSFNESFEFARNLSLQTFPFGVADIIEIEQDKIQTIDDLISKSKEKIGTDFLSYFLYEQFPLSLMRCSIFLSPVASMQFFHQWQRQRRMWWRKMSANPGRYSFSDLQTDDSTQTVEIVAKYPWGSELVETLKLNTTPSNELELQLKEGRREMRAHVVTSEIYLPVMLVNTICDAYDEPFFQGERRPLLHFHRKIAPFKISFAIPYCSVVTAEQALKDLALYLTKQLRGNQVSTLLLPSSTRLNLGTQWKQNDQLGIPYTVILNENTLTNGIALMRNRDTTLKEEVHVTDLVNYVEQLFRNY